MRRESQRASAPGCLRCPLRGDSTLGKISGGPDPRARAGVSPGSPDTRRDRVPGVPIRAGTESRESRYAPGQSPGSPDLPLLYKYYVPLEPAVMRSYQGYYTRSHQNSEVKRLWAGIVLGWVTSREVPVLHPPFIFINKLPYFSSCKISLVHFHLYHSVI